MFTNGQKIILHLHKLITVFVLSLFCSTLFAAPDDTLAVKKDSTLVQPREPSVALVPGMVNADNYNDLRAGLIYDATQNTIVWEKDMNYAYPIASLTKMMVALITVEDIRAGKADWQDNISVTHRYKKSRRSRKVYTVNATYTLEGLLKLAMIPSNNEACMSIAKHLSGEVELFVKRMNERAITLGMNQTFFSNPSGLPAGSSSMDNSSSPHDLLILAKEMIKLEEILSITDIGYADVSNGQRSSVYRNHNHLVIDYPDEVDGLKTGYTKNAKFCLVATAQKNSHRLIAVALGCRNPYTRNALVADMLNNYYQHLGLGRMANQPDKPLYASAENVSVDSMALADASHSTMSKSVTVYKTVTSTIKKRHTVRGGETLSEIAGKYHCSINEIKKWNHLRGTKLLKGQKLYVNVRVKKQVPVQIAEVENFDACEDDAPDCSPDSSFLSKQEKPVTKSKEVKKPQPARQAPSKSDLQKKFVYHLVLPGDTLWSISKRYQGVTVNDIKRWNRITNSKNLKAGSKIKIAVNG